MWLLRGRGTVMERDTHTQGGREGGKRERIWGEKERDIFHEYKYNNVTLCNGFNNFPTQEIRNVMIVFLT